MITVEVDAAGVERRLGEGRLACPGCGGPLRGWGHARERAVRDLDGLLVVRPRRARCISCLVTHVLLPVTLLARRADSLAVVSLALTARASGQGHRRIAEHLGRCPSTVRGWLRRFGERLQVVRGFFTRIAVRIAVDPGSDTVLPRWCPNAWGDAITAIRAAFEALACRFDVGAATVWQGACAATSGRLLCPSWPGPGPGGDQHELALTRPG